MIWYRAIEFNPDGWEDTNTILERLNGVHYQTICSDDNTYRKFAIKLSEADMIIARLSLSNKVSIDVFEDFELSQLKSMGYIKDDKKA